MNKNALLKRYFGHSTFRPGQEALIDALLSGRDVLGVMPTGAVMKPFRLRGSVRRTGNAGETGGGRRGKGV